MFGSGVKGNIYLPCVFILLHFSVFVLTIMKRSTIVAGMSWLHRVRASSTIELNEYDMQYVLYSVASAGLNGGHPRALCALRARSGNPRLVHLRAQFASPPKNCLLVRF